jgi:nucleotide-binding universal stress UspA family protein
MKEIKEVVVAVDGTDGSVEATKAAVRLADAMDAELTLLYVFPLVPHNLGGVTHMEVDAFEKMRDSAARIAFDKLSPVLGDRKPEPKRETRVGEPAEEILDYLDNRQDILAVVGRRGQSKIQSLLLGSVSDKVVRHTRTPVTIVG